MRFENGGRTRLELTRDLFGSSLFNHPQQRLQIAPTAEIAKKLKILLLRSTCCVTARGNYTLVTSLI
jgi:hypothetical protein